ncbi:MAG TPA: M14 family murein peptide amidase A [Solimonas sp.]|nr:M14 family murein peptide amidase A [Solimonas sp.]
MPASKAGPLQRVTARLCAGLFVAWALALPAYAEAPLASVEQACKLIGGRLRSVGVQTCLKAGLRTSTGASVNGQPLLWRDYMPSSRRVTPRRVLLIGGIHGDELSSVSVVFQWMQRLSQERFQPFHWRVIPSANPDGLLKRPPTRVNANGVDLNRNFPTENWEAEALTYWKQKTKSDPRRYPGKKPLSEPESRWLTRVILQFKPDAIVSVHAPFGVLDYDGPRAPPDRFGYLHLHLLGTYPGSLGNLVGVDTGLPVITLELPHAGIMPTPQQAQRVWADMLTWLEKNLPKREPALYMRLEDHPWDDQQ